MLYLKKTIATTPSEAILGGWRITGRLNSVKYYLSISVFWRKRCSFKSVIALIAIRFIQYLLTISLENVI